MSSSLSNDITKCSRHISTMRVIIENHEKELVKNHKIDSKKIKEILKKLEKYEELLSSNEVCRVTMIVDSWYELVVRSKEKDKK